MKGLGIDLCEIARIEHALEKTAGFLKRCYTEEERAYIVSRGNMGAQSAAAMFAAKEAFLKAVGTGIGAGIGFQDIGVSHAASGAVSYVLGQRAMDVLREKGASEAFLSLSHEAGIAAAVCVIE